MTLFTAAWKRKLLREQEELCPWCGKPLSYADATFDHIIPASHGGLPVMGNFQLLHEPCNKEKGSLCPQCGKVSSPPGSCWLDNITPPDEKPLPFGKWRGEK